METKNEEKENEDEEKQRIIMVLARYINNRRFGEFIQKKLKIKFTEPQLQKKKLTTLKGLLSKIKTHLTNKGSDQMFDLLVKNGLITYEKMLNSYIDISGFSDNLLNNSDFLDSLEMVKIENINLTIPPMYQLLFTIISTTYISYQINRINAKREMLRNVVPDKKEKTNGNEEKKTGGEEKRKDNIEISPVSLGEKL